MTTAPAVERRPPFRTLLALLCGALLLGGAAGAAEPGAESGKGDGARPIGPACEGPEHRRFDYWLGEWTVRNPEGERVGASRIRRVADGCGIVEEWRPAEGPPGTSLNFYDPARESWRQTWVGGGGQTLDLEGDLEDGVMTLYGDRVTEKGPVRDRIRWIPLEDGRVEQHWELSPDGGETWITAFRGLYEPAARP